jgi:hypothetical protein
MTQGEAVQQVERWVRDRYPVVPAVGLVLDFRPEAIKRIREVHELGGQQVSPKDVHRLRGKWCVYFRCSGDTDELGMPLRLGVLVDDETGAAELFDG